MLVALRVRGIDARGLNRRNDRGFLRVLAIDLDRPAKLGELASRGSEQVPDLECDRGMGRIDLECLICNS